MATTSRDAKLVLSVESLGQENITKLEKSLRDLAATGDASAAEFGALADQINRLGAQNDALQAVKTLSADTQGLVEAQEKASASATTLAANLDVLKAATTQAKVEQDTARAALVDGETAYKKAGNALRELKAEYDAAGKNSTDYRTKLQGLTAEQSRANLALVELRENNRQATAAVREANTEQNKAEGAYRRAATQMRVATAAADEHSKALDIAGNAAEKLGVDIANLADAETKLIATFSQAAAAVDSRKQALQEMAEADRLAAREADTLAAMLKRGEAALWAEEAALREAARGAQEYAAAKAKAAADGANWQKEADEIVSLSLAQQAATRSTQDMVEKLRELAANNAFAKQAEEARKMVQSAEYARFWADALDEADRKQQDLAANTKKVNDAFAQINARPIEAIQREIDETNAAMQTLAASGKLTGGALAVAMSSAESKVNSLQREMRELTGTMTTADRAANLLKNSMGQITAGNVIADGIGALVNKVKELGLGFVTTIAESEKLSRALNAVYKDSRIAAQQMQFLRNTAVGAGVAVGDLQPNFVKFVAATRSANISMQVTNDLFAATTRAAGTLGLSGEQVGGMLEALSQMASKGCHAPGTLIRLYDGSTAVVEHIRVGDTLVGPDTQPRVVLHCVHGEQEMYRVTPSFGAAFEVNYDHKLRLDIGEEAITVTVGQLLAMPEPVRSAARLRHTSAEDVAFVVEPVGVGRFYGFLISDDHLYLDAQGFEHHNTVSMEELRQQLGDRLPGALSLVAKGLGLTEAQLIKLVESGQLAARDLFPALTQSLKTMHGEVSGLNVTWQNFKNVLTGVAQDAGDAGWLTILTASLKVLGGTLGAVGLTLSQAWEGLRLLSLGAVAASQTIAGSKTAWAEFEVEISKASQRLDNQRDRLIAMLDPASEAAKRMRDISVAQDSASTNTDKSARSIEKFAEKIEATAKSSQALAEITKVLDNSQLDLGARIVKINSMTAERMELLDKEVIAAEKQAKAVKIQGDALVTMTQLRNSEVETLQAQSAATEKNLVAAAKAAEAQRTVTAVLTDQRNALVALAQQEATGLAGREKEIQAIDKKLTQSRAELAQSDATVAALKEESAARQQAILVLQDNSDKVAQFKQAAADAEAAVIAYKHALDAGTGSTETYAKLQQQAAKAVGLYRDTLSDLAAKTQAQSQLDQANIAIKQAGLSVQQQAYEQLAAASRATGDLTMATYYEVEAKRVQIQITKAVTEAKLLEVKAARAAIEAEREQLASNGRLTEAKKLELDARLANLKAKEIEAGASATVIKALEAEINAIQRRTTATNGATAATQGQTSAMDELYMKYRLVADYTEQMIAIQEREIAVTERAAEAYRKKWNIDKDGFTLDSNGQRMQQSVPTERYVYDQATSQGLTPQQALTLVDQYMKNGKPTGWAGASGLLGGSKDWFTVVNEAISKQVMQNNRRAASTPDTTGATTSGSGTQSSAPGKTLNINLGGRTTRVNVAGDSDANALVGLLRQLENDGSTAA